MPDTIAETITFPRVNVDVNLTWTPETGTSATVQPFGIDHANMDNVTVVFRNDLPSRIKAFDLDNQKAHSGMRALGLVPMSEAHPDVNFDLNGQRTNSSQTGEDIWVMPNHDLTFGAPLICWDVQPNYRRHEGRWVLLMWGFPLHHATAVLGVAKWNDHTAIQTLVDRVADAETLLLERALDDPDLVRSMSEEWNRNLAANALASTVVRESVHIPYTTVGKMLRTAGATGRRYSRTRVSPIMAPGTKIALAVAVKVEDQNTFDSTMTAMQQAGYYRVTALDVIREYGTTGRMYGTTVWTKNAGALDETNTDLMSWMTTQAQAVQNRWRASGPGVFTV